MGGEKTRKEVGDGAHANEVSENSVRNLRTSVVSVILNELSKLCNLGGGLDLAELDRLAVDA